MEKSIFGADHCLLGYEVAKHWNFPLSISLPILHHHDPKGYQGDDEEVRHTICAMYLSGLLLNVFKSQERPEEYCRNFQTRWWQRSW